MRRILDKEIKQPRGTDFSRASITQFIGFAFSRVGNEIGEYYSISRLEDGGTEKKKDNPHTFSEICIHYKKAKNY
ncbi:uncharacterized protein OCT59_028380 [Rhizophagus irregularis]|uniref:uncharacterized protein n=1 Tax=Rhizophagus irregularis TaxID=588596 RepID=UPI0033283B3D|nr:hypothetical protein OCT59_028380 [Rhizophagus irregularis]